MQTLGLQGKNLLDTVEQLSQKSNTVQLKVINGQPLDRSNFGFEVTSAICTFPSVYIYKLLQRTLVSDAS